jgi:hypothetical protein
LRVVYFYCQVWVFFKHMPMFFKVLPHINHYKNCTKCTSHLKRLCMIQNSFPVFQFVIISLFWHQLPHPIHIQDFRLWQQCSCSLCSSGIWYCINGWLLIMFLNQLSQSVTHSQPVTQCHTPRRNKTSKTDNKIPQERRSSHT